MRGMKNEIKEAIEDYRENMDLNQYQFETSKKLLLDNLMKNIDEILERNQLRDCW